MISIVIPVYNAATYLRDTLNSIVNQSYTNVEIIIVNDGSTDKSSEICHEYAKIYQNIMVYDRENNGVSASRNYGIEKSNGDYIWFMDSDDILEEDALLYAVEQQEKYNADVVIGGMNLCYLDKNIKIPKQIERDIALDEVDFKYQYDKLFFLNYISPLWNKLIRKKIINDNGLKLNESLCMYEDYVFCMDVLLKSKKIICLSKIFYNYQIRRNESLSRKYRENVLKMFDTLENKISEYKCEIVKINKNAKYEFDNLIIYIAFECIKNEAKYRGSFVNVKGILACEEFNKRILKYEGKGIKYKTVRFMMKMQMANLFMLYFRMYDKLVR